MISLCNLCLLKIAKIFLEIKSHFLIIQLYKISLATLVLSSSLIFSSAASATGITNLFSFDSSNGLSPSVGLTLGNNGLLYSTTANGGTSHIGSVFSFNPNGNVFSDLASFYYTTGTYPAASLTLGNNGLLYGTNLFSYATNGYNIFSL